MLSIEYAAIGLPGGSYLKRRPTVKRATPSRPSLGGLALDDL
jgi:hypothetical protein